MTNDQFVSVFSLFSGDIEDVNPSVADVATLAEKGSIGYLDDYGRFISLNSKSPEVKQLVDEGLASLSSLFKFSQLEMSTELAHSLAFYPEEFVLLRRYGWPIDEIPDFSNIGHPSAYGSSDDPGVKRVRTYRQMICVLASMAGLSLQNTSADSLAIGKYGVSMDKPLSKLAGDRTIAKALEDAYEEFS
jgi:hypothetical protein